MTELTQMIAEAEGVRTPTRKRSKAEREKIVADHNAKRAAKKKSDGAKKPAAAKAKPEPQPAKPKTTVTANNIPLNFVSDTGYVREAGYDEKTKFFYVGFAKSTWAMPSSQKEWDDFEKAIAEPNVDIDAYYRKAFRVRTGEMIPVRRKEVVA